MPRLCEFYPGICLTTEEKAQENLSHGKKNLSQSTVYILPKHPHITKPSQTHTFIFYLFLAYSISYSSNSAHDIYSLCLLIYSLNRTIICTNIICSSVYLKKNPLSAAVEVTSKIIVNNEKGKESKRRSPELFDAIQSLKELTCLFCHCQSEKVRKYAYYLCNVIRSVCPSVHPSAFWLKL